MIQVINTLAPIVLLIALGAYLGRSGFMPQRKAVWANQLVYWIALPCLLFVETAGSALDFSSGRNTLIVVLGGMAICILLGYLVAWWLGLRRESVGAFVQAGFRGNLAFIGIPVVVYSLSEGSEKSIALCMLVVAGTIPFYNVAAVLVLLAGRERFSLAVVGDIIKNLVKNPLILACLAGLSVSALGWAVPVAAMRTLESLGKTALPLALLSIGVSLNFKEIHGMFKVVLASSLIKTVISPLAGWGLGYAMGLTADEMRIALILLATPTAAASYVMVKLLRSDGQLTAGVIVMSTVLSLAPMLVLTLAFG